MGSNGGFGRESHWISTKKALNSGLGIRLRFQIRSFLKALTLGFQDIWTFLEISFWGPPILSVSFHGRPTVLILLLNRNYFVPFSSISTSIRRNGAALPSIKGFFNSHLATCSFEVEQAPSEWGAHLSRSGSRDCVGKLSRLRQSLTRSGSFFAAVWVTSRKIYCTHVINPCKLVDKSPKMGYNPTY